MKSIDPKTRLANLWWITLLTGLLAVSVYLLIYTQGRALAEWLFLLWVLVLFWWTERYNEAPFVWVWLFERLRRLKAFVVPIVAIGLSVAATIIAVRQETHLQTTARNLAVFLWLLAGLLMLFVHWRPSWADVEKWWKEYRREIIVLAIITAIGAFLRLYRLDTIPNTLDGDEGWTGLVALKLFPAASFMYDNPFSFFEGFGRIHLRLIQTAIYIFGQNKLGLRIIPAIGGIMAIPSVYLLARRLFNVRIATLAAGLLTVSHAHIHFSRISSVGYIQGTWLAPLELYFFLSGMEERDRTRLVISGLLLGLHFHFYFSAQIIIPLLFVFLLIAAFVRPRPVIVTDQVIKRPPLPIRENLKNLLWWFISMAILVLPGIVWAFRHPNDFMARWGKEGVFQSGWLARQVGITGEPSVMILLERFAHTFKAIFVLPFQDFYWAPMAVLDVITAILFVVGLFLAFRRTRDPKIMLLNGWFWSGVVGVALMAIPEAADSYRLLMVLPAMCILAAFGWAHLASLADRLGKLSWRKTLAFTSALVLIITVMNLKTYFLDVNQQCRHLNGDPVGRGLSLAGDYLLSQEPFDQAFWLGDSNFFYGAQPSTDYLDHSAPVSNMSGPFTGVDAKGSLVFIIVPSRQGDIATLRAFAPGGDLTRISDCGRLSFSSYRVDIH